MTSTLAKTETYKKRIDPKVLRVSGWPVALYWPPPMVHQIWKFPISEQINFFNFRSPKNQVLLHFLGPPKIFWTSNIFFASKLMVLRGDLLLAFVDLSFAFLIFLGKIGFGNLLKSRNARRTTLPRPWVLMPK